MQPKCESCNSCGMPLEKLEDFALGNRASAYCKYCVDPKGTLLPYDTILKANVSYYKESQGITDNAALKMAQDLLKSMPAWKNVGV